MSRKNILQESLFGPEEGDAAPGPAFDWLSPLEQGDLGAEIRKRFFLGTCSWKYPEWKGILYEAGSPPRRDEYLHDYARHLNAVEVDQWFWSLFPGGVKMPDPAEVRRYRESVPDDFRFSIKVPNSITLTHFYGNQTGKNAAFAHKPNPHFLSLPLLHQFLETLEPLGPTLGPVLFQFEYLSRTKMESLEAFLEALDRFFAEAPAGFHYAIEVRNPEYLKAPFFAWLRLRSMAPVLVEGGRMPPLAVLAADEEVFTTDFSLVRLLGWERELMESACKKRYDRIVVPQPASLQSVAAFSRKSLARGQTLYLNFNNLYEGCAPLSLKRFLGALEQETPFPGERR